MGRLKLKLFGSFRLSDGEHVLEEKSLRSNKILRVLVYLLIYRDTPQTHQKLIEIFWEDDSKKNPEIALRNLMFRLRSELKIFGNESFICTLPEAYQWNPEIPVETDYEVFERLTDSLRRSAGGDDPEGQKKLCQDIIACYQGNVTAKISGESWILPKVTWYQSVHIDAVKRLCALCEREKDWDELERLCSQGLDENPLDEELHCWVLKSLYWREKYHMAVLYYEKVNQLFYDSMGIFYPEKLKQVYQSLMPETEHTTDNINTVMKKINAQSGPEGAFLCSYQMFCQIYHLEVRRLPRAGVSAYVVLLTLRQTGRVSQQPAENGCLSGEMDILEDVLRFHLRKGDVATRYGQVQFLLLLSMCSQEGCIVVVKRLKKEFRRRIGKKHLEICYELKEAGD